MQSRGLADALLIAVARRVGRWADRVLIDRDGVAASPVASDGAHVDQPLADGPPAHWLEMVRARAPQLLSPEWSLPAATTVPQVFAAAPGDGTDDGTHAGVHLGTDARAGAATDDHAQAGDGPAAHWWELVRARAPQRAAQPSAGVARSAPAVSPVPRTVADAGDTAPVAGWLQQVGTRVRQLLAAELASSLTPREPVPFPVARGSTAGASPPSRAPSPAPTTARSADRFAASARAAPATPASEPASEAALPSSTAGRLAPTPRRPDRPADAHGDPSRWRHDPADDHRSDRGGDAPRWRILADDDAASEPGPATRRSAAAARPAPPGSAAAVPSPWSAASQRHVPVAPVAPPPVPWRRSDGWPAEASPAIAPPQDPVPPPAGHGPRAVATPRRESPWSAFQRGRESPPRPRATASPPVRWPRLPDEDDAPLPAADALWPALPVDDLETVEDPIHDHGRRGRLRGEQQGARWNERLS